MKQLDDLQLVQSVEEMKAKYTQCVQDCVDSDITCYQTIMVCLQINGEDEGILQNILLANAQEGIEVRKHFTLQGKKPYGNICSICARRAVEAFKDARDLTKVQSSFYELSLS